jgi:plastocyanin domain-containing protein
MRLVRHASFFAGLAVLALLVGDSLALAQEKAQEVAVTIQNNRFSPDEIKVKAGTPFTLVVTNKDAKPEEFESTELRIEKVIPAGKTASIRVRALKPGTYPFVGEFNPKTAQGRIVAE